ncbi:hypothetical protein AUM41_08235 [Cronobacter malonaticus]|nr:hypothetical protein [Cronobacter malonaticus]EGT4420920.1 hypothetical protein [Cronobacter malonaticus]EGT4447765.1 hypothetical protein [Cronobacter malonaticus]EGT4454253.1 hypothetical protein [Cronobacter malonaticus]PUX15874.1 hypothetical protein BS413_17970 [Cronobacter malonaticus]
MAGSPRLSPPERSGGVIVMSCGGSILPEAFFIHNRFNTPFTCFASVKPVHFLRGCTRSRFSRLHLLKMLTSPEF